MNIGFDAKRAFLNQSGLGNYSRTLILSLLEYYPDIQLSLFTTSRKNDGFSASVSEQKNVSIIEPKKFFDKKVNFKWRSYGIASLLSKNKIDVYHGLSNELPFNISAFKGKKIVTIHDLIFLRYPKLYPLFDRTIYNKKFKRSCENADVVIATSEQTKSDILHFYSIKPQKIKVVYQSCNKVFYKETSENQPEKIRLKYNLPGKYLLYVGTIEERKNLLVILKALTIVRNIPLVVIGKKKSYFKKIQEFVAANNLENRVLFLESIPNEELPVIYRYAEVFIYPSLFEGFGIPIIEALTSKVPVITTQSGCFSEAGGKNSLYIDPTSQEQLAEEIKRLLTSPELRKEMIEKGFEHSKKFLPEIITSDLMKIYADK